MSDEEVEVALSQVLSAPQKPRKPRILPAFITKAAKKAPGNVSHDYPTIEEVMNEDRISYLREMAVRVKIPKVSKYKKGDIEVLRELILAEIP